jgi:hypothetical protein
MKGTDMKKPTNKTNESAWDIEPTEPEVKAETPKKTTHKEVIELEPVYDSTYDMEGLMTDFPTAKELEKFVFDQTGVVLNLKGRANKLKYQVAMDTLNGKMPSMDFLGNENPYLDKNEIIPSDPLREPPPQPTELHGVGEVTRFVSNSFPHPDAEWKATGQRCQVIFRKYTDTSITYEIIGPIGKRAVGIRVNKYGKEQPEKFTWVDPRTGEQIIRDSNGRLTPIGTRLRGFMKNQKVNKSNQWDVWIDRDFIMSGDAIGFDNPWNN